MIRASGLFQTNSSLIQTFNFVLNSAAMIDGANMFDSISNGFDLGNILPVGLSAAQLAGDLSLKFQVKGDGPNAASTQNLFELKPADLIVHPANISRYIGP